MSSLKEIFHKLAVATGRVSTTHKLFMVQNLGVMMRAGVPLTAALAALIEQTENAKLKFILADIKANVEKGHSFNESLARYPKIFGELFVNMIKAGESSGKLEEALVQTYQQMKKSHELVRKVRGALIYPTVVVVAMVGIAIAMMILVIPNISKIFKEVNATLPLATRVLISTSNFMVQHGLWLSLIVVVSVVIFWRLIKWRPTKYYWQAFLLVFPVVGGIIKKINVARISRTLGSLLNTDVPIIFAIQITANVLGNTHYQKALMVSKEQIKKGVSLEESLSGFKKLFPPVVSQMIAVGEKSGSLDSVLGEMANYYEEEINQTMTDLPSLLEPFLILILGAGVGGMAMAVIMPMYSLAEQM